MSIDYGRDLETAYRIACWKDDPWTREGRERYTSALRRFKLLLKHPWFKEILSKDVVKILDLCSGKGIGGVALAKVIQENTEVELSMVDIREEAVEASLRFAKSEGVSAKALVKDAKSIHTLGLFDIVLVYGGSLAHFNSWDLIKLLASATTVLEKNGVIIVEEMDRAHVLFTRGYKDFIVENPNPQSLAISIHIKYDPVTGSYYRRFIRLKDEYSVTLPINFRSISTIASILWLFVKNIDLLSTSDENIYLIIGRRPRRKITPEDLSESPIVLKRRSIYSLGETDL